MSKKETTAQLEADFKASLSKYKKLISDNWSCRIVNKNGHEEIKEEIVRIFKKVSSAKLRNKFLLQTLLVIGRSYESLPPDRNSWFSRLAFELHDKLVAVVTK
ncbi:MAG: hypothetical protein WCF93_03350 [Candidatus Moraniibacteriota bacterium]